LNEFLLLLEEGGKSGNGVEGGGQGGGDHGEGVPLILLPLLTTSDPISEVGKDNIKGGLALLSLRAEFEVDVDN